MLSNNELVEAFYSGYSSGVANNMSLDEMPGSGIVVIGYGHAIYAYRPPDDRYSPVVFTGWSTASSSSSQHINMLTRDECIELDGAAEETDISGDPDISELSKISGNDEDYGGKENMDRGGMAW